MGVLMAVPAKLRYCNIAGGGGTWEDFGAGVAAIAVQHLMSPRERKTRSAMVISGGDGEALCVMTTFTITDRRGLELPQVRVAVTNATGLRDSAVAYRGDLSRMLHMLEPG